MLVTIPAIAVVVGAWFYSRGAMSNVGDLAFENPLRVPPLLEPTMSSDGMKQFELNVQAAETEFKDGQHTPTWGVNGSYLGPTIRASAGDRVELAVTNGVNETTTMHWHGMHLPAEADGGPHQLIEPGTTWTPTWTIDQPAATLWYHPHLHGTTAEHVYRGVAGLFLLDDERSGELDLPDTYGVDDVPLIIQDKRFKGDGQLDFGRPLFAELGILGRDILVNGTYDPHLDVTTERVRFRVLNASNARTYNLGFPDDRPFQLIATDSGLLGEPVTLERLPLSPGERAEIVVSFSPGEDAVLRSFAPDLGADFFTDRFNGGDDTFDLVQFRAADHLDPVAAVPDTLVAQEPLDPTDATTRTFAMSGHRINDQEMAMDRIDHVVTVDTTEIWKIEGRGMPHNFHVHDVRFQILDIDGRPPAPHLTGWKDTVAIRPGSTVRVIMRFTDYTSVSSPYMFHCHILEHEDRGMMGQFVVVEPGQAPVAPPPGHDHGG